VPRGTVVFVPGMMLDERMYAFQAGALSNRADVLHADVTRAASIEAMAADVIGRCPLRFAVIGLSMGGIVAMEIVRQAKERVTHLALLNTTPEPDSPEKREPRLQQLAAVESGGLRQVLVDSLKPRYLARKNKSNLKLLGEILTMGLDLGPDVFRRQAAALTSRPDGRAVLPSITCPTLVLTGWEDDICPPEIHEMMARTIPRADLVVLSECGHLSPLESPQSVTNALDSLLRRTP
jgi:pimeloyl-ACP methyl ester carboxylesterase